MVTWKAFHAVVTTLTTGTLACLYLLHVITGLVAVGIDAAAGTVFVLLLAWVVAEAPLFSQVPHSGRSQIVRLVAVGAAAHALWTLAVVLRPDLWAVWLVSLGVIGCLAYWVAVGHQYLLEQMNRAPAREVERAERAAAEQDKVTQVLAAGFTGAGFRWLTILGWEQVADGGRIYGVRATVRVPSHMAMTRAGEKSKAPTFGPASAEPIAVALAEVMRREIMTDWVVITKLAAAGTYSVLVVTEDVMSRVHPYVDDLAWSTITERKLVGHQMDGRPYLLRLDQHGQISGQARSGKSSLVHVELAEVTKCRDAVAWIGGVEKLYDLVGGWVEPYAGTDHPLPIDWIASGQTDLLTMLVTAMTVARWRQRQPMSARAGFMRILLYLDEASFALRNTKAKAEYSGVARTAAELVAMLTQGAGSAGVHVRFISQRGVNSHFGDQGGDTTANAGWVAAFRTRDSGDIGRLTGDYSIPVPRHAGEYIIESGDGATRLKAPYIQEVDPARPRVHDGLTVSDVAWSRRTFPRTLDAGSTRTAGQAYADRHTRMTPALMAYLTDTPTDEGGQSHSFTEGAAMAAALLDDLGVGPGAGKNTAGYTGGSAPSAQPAGGVTTMVGRRSRAVRIAEIVRASEVALSRAEIQAALAASGDPAPEQAVTNALSRLVADGALQRPGRGLYQAVRA